MEKNAISLVPLALSLLIILLIWALSRRSRKSAPPAGLTALPIPEYRGPLAFFRRHWNGDYSLGRSYWLNTVLVAHFAPVVGLLLLPWLGANFPARYGSAGALAFTALGVVAWFWAVSGTWASASKHVARGGKQVWARAAKVMICLGVVKIFGDIGNALPTLAEHARVASGAQFGQDTMFEVRTDGRSLLLSGGINDGSARQLDNALSEAPAVTTVVLASQGGWLREGERLAEVIRRRSLDTYVESYCASACTIAFLAGKDRAAAPTARIGFHASRSVGSTRAMPTADETARLRTVYGRAGLPDTFVKRALDTPSDSMWHPSIDEMLAAGVLTRRSMGGETAAIATMLRSRDVLATEFRKVAAFAAIAEHSPPDFERIVDAAWAKVEAGATDAEVTSAGREQVRAMLPRLLPLASDATLVAYQQLMQQQMEVLRSKDPVLCVEMIFPSGRPNNVAAHFPQEFRTREHQLIAQVVREADPARAIGPDPQAAERVGTRAAKGMTPREITIFGDEATRRTSHPEAVCDAAIKFFAGLNAIPVAERGKALRIIYSSN